MICWHWFNLQLFVYVSVRVWERVRGRGRGDTAAWAFLRKGLLEAGARAASLHTARNVPCAHHGGGSVRDGECVYVFFFLVCECVLSPQVHHSRLYNQLTVGLCKLFNLFIMTAVWCCLVWHALILFFSTFIFLFYTLICCVLFNFMTSFIFMALFVLMLLHKPCVCVRHRDALSSILVFDYLCFPKSINFDIVFFIYLSLLVLYFWTLSISLLYVCV